MSCVFTQKATSAKYKSNAKGVFFCQKEGVDLVVATRWISTLNCGLFFEFASLRYMLNPLGVIKMLSCFKTFLELRRVQMIQDTLRDILKKSGRLSAHRPPPKLCGRAKIVAHAHFFLNFLDVGVFLA